MSRKSDSTKDRLEEVMYRGFLYYVQKVKDKDGKLNARASRVYKKGINQIGLRGRTDSVENIFVHPGNERKNVLREYQRERSFR